jgi:hypothetical protein
MRSLVFVLLLVGFAAGRGTVHAEDRALTLSIGPEARRFTAAQLLDRADSTELTVPADVSYGRPMKYRAVPLLPLLSGVGAAFDTIEARAADGFVSQIPLALVKKGATGGARAWIAIEKPVAPWPALPGKTVSAGPFYLVWENPERSGSVANSGPISSPRSRRSSLRHIVGRRWRLMRASPRMRRRDAARQCSRSNACPAIA